MVDGLKTTEFPTCLQQESMLGWELLKCKVKWHLRRYKSTHIHGYQKWHVRGKNHFMICSHVMKMNALLLAPVGCTISQVSFFSLLFYQSLTLILISTQSFKEGNMDMLPVPIVNMRKMKKSAVSKYYSFMQPSRHQCHNLMFVILRSNRAVFKKLDDM